MAKLQLHIQLTKDPATIHNVRYEDIAFTTKSNETDRSGYRHITIGLKPVGDGKVGGTIECPVSADQDIEEVFTAIQKAIAKRDENKAFMFPYDPRA